MYYTLSQIQRLDRKLLALEKTPPLIGNRQFTQNNQRWHTDFIAATDIRYETRKRPLVRENPPATPSGVNRPFAKQKVIMG